jgi:hypothetical protein
MIKNAMLAVVAAGGVAVAASGASAATYPTFVLDTAKSTINIDLSQGCLLLLISTTTLEAEFAESAHNFVWTPSGPNDWIFVDDFIDWTMRAVSAWDSSTSHSITGIEKAAPSLMPDGQRAVTVLVRV